MCPRRSTLHDLMSFADDAQVFFMRYSPTLVAPGEAKLVPFENFAPHAHQILLGAMPTGKSGPRDWSLVNPLTYKTVRTIEFLLARKYDFFIRSNANIFLDLPKLCRYLSTSVPRSNVWAAPFYQHSVYPTGYFMLASADVAKHMVDAFAMGLVETLQVQQGKKYNRPPSSGADDCDLHLLATGRLAGDIVGEQFAPTTRYQVMLGGTPPRNEIKSKQYPMENLIAIRLDNDHGDRGHELSSNEALDLVIKHWKPMMFMYRYRSFTDDDMVTFLIKLLHIAEQTAPEKWWLRPEFGERAPLHGTLPSTLAQFLTRGKPHIPGPSRLASVHREVKKNHPQRLARTEHNISVTSLLNKMRRRWWL